MKKIVLLLSLLFCLTGITSPAADDEQFIPLQVLDNPPRPGKTHRAPVYIPIQVYYDEPTSTVQIRFLQNIGLVNIVIADLNIGTYAEYNIESTVGAASFPVDDDNGIYQIIMLLSNGVRYVGSFSIGTF